ncbi:hypothetical protein [Gemmatimonas sp. UBA7669]|uniref:hypothetical protein n=1 Tax=Gemmatimonas sp. UBA7669 TaxID=1946568 RepID=UPI0025B84C4B|nr:hypothetical protein [Gemmatimonas sp. UBA7669]
MSEDQVAPPAPHVPDRADAPVSEVTERFLRAVIAEVPLELIEELHLFSPLRQGTVETGIAVLAARKAAPMAEEQLELAEEQQTAIAVEAEAVAPEAEGAEQQTAIAEAAEAVAPEAEIAEAEGAEPAVEATAVEATDVEAAEVPAAAVSPRLPSTQRHTVFTARYRYVIKGPERGKWEASLKAEADAPLITVETVVRGVQRRAGEESEIVRYSAAQIARALRLPLNA